MIISKNFILKIIAYIFGVFLFIKYVLTKILLTVFGKFPLKVVKSLKRANFQICSKIPQHKQKNLLLEKNTKIELAQISDYIQSIIDSAISMCLTASLVNYNKALVQGTLLISHHIHHSFLSLIKDQIPDFTENIRQQYSSILIWALIIVGFFGFSIQTALIIDLINIFTFPTKIFYRFLRLIYGKSISLIGALYEFIKTNQTKWITCPYNSKLINSNFRSAALAILILLIQMIIFTVFYYAWLSMVILVLMIVLNILENFYFVSLKLGQNLCLLKHTNLSKKVFYFETQFNSLLDPQSIIGILRGTDLFKAEQKSPNLYKKYGLAFNFNHIISTFTKIGKNEVLQDIVE